MLRLLRELLLAGILSDMQEYLSGNKYAKTVGVAQCTIVKAIKERRVITTSKGIDPTHPSNVHYESLLRAKRGPLPKDLIDQPAPPVQTDPEPAKVAAKKEIPRTRAKPSAAAPPRKPKAPPRVPTPNEFKTKVDFDIEKLEVQTAKLRAELAQSLGVHGAARDGRLGLRTTALGGGQLSAAARRSPCARARRDLQRDRSRAHP